MSLAMVYIITFFVLDFYHRLFLKSLKNLKTLNISKFRQMDAAATIRTAIV
jgi:hypothetical protein